MLNILIVEDEAAVRMLTRAKLRNEYNILEAANGAQALELLDHEHIDLIIADIMMPQMDGYELVQALRGNGNMTPIIMLTAMNTYAHKKKGFATGIDDYMTKPIDYEELKWRISALLRRAKIANEKQINVGNLMFKADSLSAEIDGKTVELTEKESSLLYKLLSYPGIVFTKQQLMDEIWGYDSESDYSTIKTYISRLRNKLGECRGFELVSVRGLGYNGP
ncbi:MAG: response regulator transcription factor [Oscillospiraceae bacterium]